MINKNVSEGTNLKGIPNDNKILISYCYLPKQISSEKIEFLLASLPMEEQFRIKRMIGAKAKVEKLFSRLLLEKSYREISKLKKFKYGYTKDGKPVLINDPTIGISISHSNDLVVCAFAFNAEIGIDIEFKIDRDISVFKKCFMSAEWDHIHENNKDRIQTFYELWVRKEAAIKADGKGLKIPLHSFSCLNDKARIGQNEWYFLALDHFKGYAGQIACNKKASVHFLNFTEK